MLATVRAAIDESHNTAASLSASKAVGQGSAGAARLADAAPFVPPSVQPVGPAKVPEDLRFLSDVNLNVTIELGRTRMYVEDVLRLGPGAVVELDKLAGDPVDVYVNNRHVARGEVLVLNDNFCVRINEILSLTE
ncbi:MAG: flagellar motor switch protein FliN [Leptolyngbya sp. PLA3]|nr:MAG: flagellar motor switch protein FliN [Cyanobacteria bacterium CYA]MCE7968875.1 flagellar motor switch protein FliN [Leptolyngbya sp. PL-A3]